MALFFAIMVLIGTQETIKSIFMSMTKRNNAPIKLWIESPQEMRVISNKRVQLAEIFEWLDYKQLGRINTLELFAVILTAISGSQEMIVQSKFQVFSSKLIDSSLLHFFRYHAFLRLLVSVRVLPRRAALFP